MQALSSPRAIDLAVDIQALRHLVTRREIAESLWFGKMRTALEAALRTVHGDDHFDDIERCVSQQILLGQIKLLPDLIERLYERNNDQRAQQILAIVKDIFHANSQNSTSLEFHDDFVELLLQAVIHASLQVIMQAEQNDIGPAYRTTIDLIRKLFHSSESSSTATLKKIGVKLVKDVVTILTQSDQHHANARAEKFLSKYSHKDTARNLQAQADVLEKELPPLSIRHTYVQATVDAHGARPKRRGRGRKRRLALADKPDFFSDHSDETSNVTPDDESVPNDDRNVARKGGIRDEFDSEALSVSSIDTPRPPRKRSRKSREKDRAAVGDDEGLENGERRTRSVTPVSRSRGKRYPRMEQELNGMNSPMFSETRHPSERVDHVVRHAKSKGRKRRGRPPNKGRRSANYQRSPQSISLEESSPAHRARHDPHDGDRSGGEGHRSKGIDTDDENAIGRMGREGTVLQDLHAKATKLQKAGPSDPLQEAVRDARQAKRRKRKSDPTYYPGVDARGASPFPDSGDESDLSRKKITRVQLVQSPRDPNAKRQASAFPGAGGMMFGKTCRTGRFEPFEDKLLHDGLQALGWGAWKEIAREYWDGDFTRAPSSLKDRARTLGLGPHRYPRRIELRGRPRLSEHQDDDDGSAHEASPRNARADEDHDEDHDEDRDEDRDNDRDNDRDEDRNENTEAQDPIIENGTPGS